MYLLRGVSGSGKSTIAKSLPGVNSENIFSTDNLLPQNPEDYISFFKQMEKNKSLVPLQKAHNLNVQLVSDAMEDNVTPVVIDNTNLEAWNAKPYVELAIKHGYLVKIIDVGTGGLTAKELAKRNKHNVPLEVIEKMIDKYQQNGELTVDKILDSNDPNQPMIS
jgi:predicted kinase